MYITYPNHKKRLMLALYEIKMAQSTSEWVRNDLRILCHQLTVVILITLVIMVYDILGGKLVSTPLYLVDTSTPAAGARRERGESAALYQAIVTLVFQGNIVV